MGLNLKERSSGKYQGKLKISKRGSGACRRWLHLAALRQIRDDRKVRLWYARKCGPAGKDKGRSGRLRVVTALVRKLALAMWVVGAAEGTFEVERLLGLPAQRRRPANKTGRKGGVAIAAR